MANKYWAGTLHSVEPRGGSIYVKEPVVFASDYDAIAKQLAEAEAALASATLDTWWAKEYFKKHVKPAFANQCPTCKQVWEDDMFWCPTCSVPFPRATPALESSPPLAKK